MHWTFRRVHPARVPLVLILAGLLAGPVPGAAAQEPGDLSPTRYRIGVVVGATALVSLVGEIQRGDWSGELAVGTLSFRDVSFAATAKRYTSGGSLRPYLGAGVWTLVASSERGRGAAFIVRAPLGLNLRVADGHDLGLELGFNRALWIRRMDPDDDTPPNPSLVPLPGLYYRHGWQR